MAQILILIFFTLQLFAEFSVESLQEIRYKEVIKQNYEESCGASSLATLLNLDNNNLSEKDILKNINTTDAISLYSLEKLAKKYGYQSKSYKINLKILKTLKYPVIARIARDKNYPHFVVIKIKKNKIIVLDPNYGKYSLSYYEFKKIWTKYIFIVLPKKNGFKKINSIDISKYSFILDLK